MVTARLTGWPRCARHDGLKPQRENALSLYRKDTETRHREERSDVAIQLHSLPMPHPYRHQATGWPRCARHDGLKRHRVNTLSIYREDTQPRHREERSDVAIQSSLGMKGTHAE